MLVNKCEQNISKTLKIIFYVTDIYVFVSVTVKSNATVKVLLMFFKKRIIFAT